MFQDKHLKNCKRQYAIKGAELIGKVYDREYFNYSHQQLEDKDLLKILGKLKNGLYEALVDGKIINVKSAPNRKGASIRSTGFDHKWVNEKLKELLEARLEADQWGYELNPIFTSFPKILSLYKETQKKILLQKINQPLKKTPFQINMEKFAAVFKLSKKEIEIITFLYLDKTDEDVDDYFSSRKIDLTKITAATRYFCRFFELKPGELKNILAKDSVLIKAGIVTRSKRDDELELSTTVASYLGGINKQSIEDDYVKEADLLDSISLSSHNINENHLHAINNLLATDRGCNIILYGHPGTGKTEFAKSLAKESGKRIYFINQSDNDGEESLDFRKQAIIAAHNIIQDPDSIIVVDECDKIININNGMWKCDNNEGSDRKAWINEFLENAKHKIIWISNRVDGIDESTKRRFSYSLEFSPLSFTQRKKVWETQIQKQGISFVDSDDVLNLAKNLKVNSGGITLALKDVQGMNSLKTKDQKLEVLKTILMQHQSFTSESEGAIIKKTSKYDLSILNSDYPLEKLLQYTEQFLKERVSFNDKGVFNLNLLLQGPPGTGKTEFVKHLADVTDREIVIKRASDIRSKWYGESVKNIAQSFKEAQEQGSILFFDEADSFFGTREGGSEYHAEETNEFLTQMENFQGILICATNFTQKLDQASLRRFNYKVKFDYLTNSAKLKMFQTYFSDQCIDGSEMSLGVGLERIAGLTPGDFKVVYQKNIFNEKRTAEEFLKELENEVSYKNAFSKKVGLS